MHSSRMRTAHWLMGTQSPLVYVCGVRPIPGHNHLRRIYPHPLGHTHPLEGTWEKRHPPTPERASDKTY